MKGWFNQGWRHGLSARGIPTGRSMVGRTSFASKALIKNHELATLRRMVGDDASEDNIKGALSKIRSGEEQHPQPAIAMAAKEEKKEGVSWMAPFSEDKSGVGEQININIIMEEHQKADEKMRNHGVDPKDIIRKHDEIERNCNEDFKKGHIDADEYRRKIHNIISHGTAVPNPSGTDENGHGVFNFIDRAKDSKSVNVAMAARPTAKELVRQAMAAKRPDNRKEVFSPYVEEEEPKHHSQEYVDEHVANLSPGEKLLGIGMIVQNHTIERMKK